jgi:hypothetical protein
MKDDISRKIGILFLAVFCFLLFRQNIDMPSLFIFVLIPGLMIVNLFRLNRVEKKLDKLLEEKEGNDGSGSMDDLP